MDEANQPSTDPNKKLSWFALRDLKRINSKTPGYKELSEEGFEVYTPMKWVVKVVRGRRKRTRVPVLSDLLFVHSDRDTLNPVVDSTPTLQYRYARGGYCVPIVVRDDDMIRFIKATSATYGAKYYTPDEASQLSVGQTVTITSGPMTGVEAKIVKVKGARKKRILVSIPGIIAAVVEVDGDAIEVS